MQVTIQSIIRTLPFEESFKKHLSESWNTFSPDQKYLLADRIWKTYFAVYDVTFEKNLQEELMLIQKGQKPKQLNLHQVIREKTETELSTQLQVGLSSQVLIQAREELENIIKSETGKSIPTDSVAN